MRNYAYRKHKEFHKFKTRCERWYFCFGRLDFWGHTEVKTLYEYMQKHHVRQLKNTWTTCSGPCCGNPRKHRKSEEKYTVQELRDFLNVKEQIREL